MPKTTHQFEAVTVPNNLCDYEDEFSIYDKDSGFEYEGPLGFDITSAWVGEYGQPSYTEHTARLRWMPLGRELVTRDFAVLICGAKAIEEAEAAVSERYTEANQ